MSINRNKGDAMCMQLKSTSAALAALVILALSSTAGCSRIGNVQATLKFKQANQAYQLELYPRAATLYEETVQADPNIAQVYFYLGNSYDNQYLPGIEDADNVALINKAVKNYALAAEKLNVDDPAEARLKKLSMEYLVAAYGLEKLNDPAKAEPIIQDIIQLDLGDPTHYFALSKLYEDAGFYAEAEDVLNMAKEAKPSDPLVYVQLAGYYNRNGEFEKTIDALEERARYEPENPAAFYTISTYYWDKVYRDPLLSESEKIDYLMKGLDAVDHSIELRPDYVEALVYKNLLLRLQANVETEPSKQQALLREADVFRDKAEETRRQKATGVGD